MEETFLLGLDFGTESARGVLVDATSGKQVGSKVVRYPQGVISGFLPDGTPLPKGWALQDAADYVSVTEEIFESLARERYIAGIGVGFTASSPLPADTAGRPLSDRFPDQPHAYVKLWKHASAQKHADRVSSAGGEYLANFGGRVSGEWLLAKASEIADEAPEIWAQTDRFIEAGDWIVWRLTGTERRSRGFAAYKAQYRDEGGYPDIGVEGLSSRLSAPSPVGSNAGELSTQWRERFGISGPAQVAVAVIDSHVVLPAVGGVRDGCLVAALGTSAVYLQLSREFRSLPEGIEGVARDGSVAGFYCYEAGQPAFGDTLAWFVRTFPRDPDPTRNFALYNEEAAKLAAGEAQLLALDWWNGNRVPLADTKLSGLLLGLTTQTSAAQIYRALLESICFGARRVVELFEAGGLAVDELIVTSGLAANNPFLLQLLSDVLGRPLRQPIIDNPTALGAAIHGAVAAGVVSDFQSGAEAFGTSRFATVTPNIESKAIYDRLYTQYCRLGTDREIQDTMHGLADVTTSIGRQDHAAGRPGGDTLPDAAEIVHTKE